jgi:predicted SnoaL-like aldol condensation-catalyzing enzyme
MSKLESAMRVVLEYKEAFNRNDVSSMMQLMSDDCTFENAVPAPDGTVYEGNEEVTQFWQGFFHNSPQARIEIEEIFSVGERCIMRWKYSWLNSGGDKEHIRGVDIFRVSEGLINEQLAYVKGAVHRR